jgi:tetratricopeptide (TPR) repeat protein
MIIMSIGGFTGVFDSIWPGPGVRPPDNNQYTKSERSYYNSGVSNMQEGKLDRAINDFSQVIIGNPNHDKAYYNRGVCYMKTGDYDKAILDFSEVIKRAPNRDSAYYNRGVSYEKTGQIDEAIDDFKNVLKLSKNPTLRQQSEDHLRTLGVK